jgi:hypothetical protein
MSSRLTLLGLVALVAVGGGAAVFAAIAPLDDAAEVAAVARRLDPGVGDLAVAFDVGEVDQFVIDASAEAARRAGGSSATRRGGSIGLRRITRDGATVHAPPPDYLIPMVFSAAPLHATRGAYGIRIAQVTAAGDVVVNELTAALTGVRVGDRLELRTSSGGTVTLRVGMIAAYDAVGGSELVFDTAVATRLGFTSDTSTVMWGFDRAALESALAAVGLDGRADTAVSRSWDLPDPDETISTARTKVALGEPWYRVNADDSISMHPDWIGTNLTPGRVLLDPNIRVRAQCHREVVGDLSAALADVAAAGLASQIDVANANAYGGCYAPRYSRISGYLSRHTYAMAFDTNTAANCQGCRPRMHCDVVRIFRRHGFAWGGNFRRPDGMHFEWVGSRRDQIPYPSPYCPNVVPSGTERVVPTVGREVLAQGPTGDAHGHLAEQHDVHHDEGGPTP